MRCSINFRRWDCGEKLTTTTHKNNNDGMAAKSNGKTGGSETNGVFRLSQVTDMQQIPDPIWDALEEEHGVKRHELPTFSGHSTYCGRFPGLDRILPAVASVLRRFDGTVVSNQPVV